MLPLSKTTLGFAAAGAGLCFIGYCVYFDQKRRSDPDFKKKLKESESGDTNNNTVTSVSLTLSTEL